MAFHAELADSLVAVLGETGRRTDRETDADWLQRAGEQAVDSSHLGLE